MDLRYTTLRFAAGRRLLKESAPAACARPEKLRAGFSFVEVLFAVMILGIGFIMVAGIFPVSIQQVGTTVDETNAAMIARGASARLSKLIAWNTLTPTDGAMVKLSQLSPDAWERVKGELIWEADPRYAWIPLVKFDGGDRPAQVTIIVIRNRTGRAFDQRDLIQANPASNRPAALEPRTVTVTLTEGGNGPDIAEFAPSSDVAAAVPGAYLIIGSDRSTGASSGHAYRLGNRLDDAGLKWELMPGSDLSGPDEELLAARAYLVGRAEETSGSITPIYSGAGQDVAVFTTLISGR